MAHQPLVAIAGLMGSGKTTLARGLASALGWRYVPARRPETRLLEDLFKDPKRWAFDAQVAFLVSKALQIREVQECGEAIILDRSIDEDVQVFGQYFVQSGKMDDRSAETYRTLAEGYFRDLPRPDLLIFCRCSWTTAKQRANARPNSIVHLYPPEYFEEIARLCDEWVEGYDRSSVFQIDTEITDTRVKKVLSEIASEVLEALSAKVSDHEQVDLFGTGSSISDAPSRHLHPLVISPEASGANPRRRPVGVRGLAKQFPTAYVGGPFTSYAEPPPDDGSLFAGSVAHGVLPEGEYRDFLLGIERGLKRIGVGAFIPHRDINDWGDRHLSPNVVTQKCIEAVTACDIFVGLLSTSHGTHLELGVAIGQAKPAILLRVDGVDQSFIASGLSRAAGDILVLEVESFGQIESVLASTRVKEFLAKYVPVT